MKHSKPVNLYKPSTGNNKSLVRILSAIIICLVTFVFHQQKDTSPNHLIEKIESNEEQLSRQAELTEKIKAELTASITEYKNTVKILEQRLKESHDERDAAESSKKDLQTKLRGANGKEKENNGDEKEIESMKKSIDAVSTQIDHLKAEMQKSAKIDALKKFGPGPHRVKFELDFHPDEIPAGDATSFVIEMAPLDLMPYTVNFFLSQVNLGLFNGCSFHRNAGHVVQGGPIANHLNPGAHLNKGFKDAGLASVAFQEYSADFPHKKYTLGYAGRPGGPDFYISTLDNTRNHGPGGQSSYAVKGEADPCYAKVVEGFEAVDRMHSQVVQKGDYMRLVHYVAIKSATILTDEK